MGLLVSCNHSGNQASLDISQATTLLNIPYGATSRQQIDAYLPANRNDTTPLVIMYHGGGWVMGDRTDNAAIAEMLRDQGIASVSVGYRLVDTATHVAAPQIGDDIRAGTTLAISLRAHWGIAQGKLGTFGISAGGHLAQLYGYAYDSLHQVSKVISYAGPSDLKSPRLLSNATMALMVNQFLDMRVGGDSLDATPWNPMDHIDSLDPASLIIHGSIDTLVSPSQSVELDSILRLHHVQSQLVIFDSVGHAINSSQVRRIVNLIVQAMQ